MLTAFVDAAQCPPFSSGPHGGSRYCYAGVPARRDRRSSVGGMLSCLAVLLQSARAVKYAVLRAVHITPTGLEQS